MSAHMDHAFSGARNEISDVRSEIGEVKTDIQNVKNELTDVKNEVITEIDRFVVLHQTLDVELAALRSKTNRHDTFLHKVAKKLDLEFEPT